jgi:hypothetical protein
MSIVWCESLPGFGGKFFPLPFATSSQNKLWLPLLHYQKKGAFFFYFWPSPWSLRDTLPEKMAWPSYVRISDAVSALETTMLPKRLQIFSLLILLFNTSIFIL